MLVPATTHGREVATLAAGMLAAHLRDDIPAFRGSSAMFETCGQMHQGLIFLASALASDLAERDDTTAEEVAQRYALLLQGLPEVA